MIVLDLLTSSFRLAGVLHEGQGPSDDLIDNGLLSFNGLLEAWNIENLTVYQVERHEYTLTVGKQDYQIGNDSGYEFHAPRPAKIERAGFIWIGDNSSPQELPVRILSAAEWRDEQSKKVPSMLVDKLYYEPAMPNGVIHVWPVPSFANKLALYTWHALPSVADETVDLSLPPAFSSALRYNLADQFIDEFNRPPRPNISTKAAFTKAAIQALNAQVVGVDVPTQQAPPAQAPAVEPQRS